MINKNIYIVPTLIPGNTDLYPIYVHKTFWPICCDIFSKIYKKVSDKSPYKLLVGQLSDVKKWNQGRPISYSSMKRDDNKYFEELSIEEISILKDVFYAYKNSKFTGCNLKIADLCVERDTVIRTVLIRARNSFLRNKSRQALDSKVLDAKRERRREEHKKYAKLLEESLKRFDDAVNAKTKNIIDRINKLVPTEGDKLDYKEFIYHSMYFDKKTDQEKQREVLQKRCAVINNFQNYEKLFREKYLRKKKGAVQDELIALNSAEVVKLLDMWMQNVGSKIFSHNKTMDLITKHLIHKYRIISVLGSGGTAVVVKFINKKGQERALKIFSDPNSEDFSKEAGAGEIISSFGNRKKYFNAPKKDKYGNIRMKLADEVLDADKYINRADDEKSDLTIDFFKRLARQILKGLAELHEKGFIHGDIKPDNIQIVGGRFKIADFGTLARASEGVAGSTYSYAHPGIKANSGEEQKQKNDVYALGCSLMDVLRGKRSENYIDFSIQSLLKEVSGKYVDESMKNKNNVRELLGFIQCLCNKDLDKVPTAKEALHKNFCVKTV